MASRLYEWLDERLGLGTIYDTVFDRNVPKVNWFYTLGSATLFLFTMQAVTGIFLTVYYVPSPDHAYDSIQYIMNGVAFGWLISRHPSLGRHFDGYYCVPAHAANVLLWRL